ncbi:MAG: tRNA (guanosine(37)-N1)-methyltransferase TrmD [Candidatus Cloacimonetes bacterium]|nr:tRNA (guanosine(37)-N1)-methyltransferase TrmD [Candidatus Cloacimonadota bacterium]
MHDIRDFGKGKNKTVDSAPYGGGAGMVISVEPVHKCLLSIESEVGSDNYKKAKVVLMGADGAPYKQKTANNFARIEHLVLICGHYKGIDERILNYIDEKLSIGDYVLTGGELAAMIVVDSVARLLPGVVSDFESVSTDSHYEGLLGASCYTRPEEYDGHRVPKVLLEGNHKLIDEYRFMDSVEKTMKTRPDLYESYEFSKLELKLIKNNKSK